MDESGCVPSKLYLWILQFEFHIIFMCAKILLCFPPFKNVKSINSWPGEGELGGSWIWSLGHSVWSPGFKGSSLSLAGLQVRVGLCRVGWGCGGLVSAWAP